ncbi:MAG: protein translocase subunit SecDF, partial [Lachnospiraceae bacterium]|nr:protein translocase subunit SecDF [Lachnospiraceae bacterium]
MKRMKKSTGVVIFIIFLAIIVSLGYYAFTILKSTGIGKDRNLKLGLDLAGGVSITYGAVGETPTAEQMSDTIYKLQQRIENDLGEEAKTTEANVYQVGLDRIAVEIPGVQDANKVLEELGTPGKLYFIKHKYSSGNENYSYNSTTGNYELNKTIEEI